MNDRIKQIREAWNKRNSLEGCHETVDRLNDYIGELLNANDELEQMLVAKDREMEALKRIPKKRTVKLKAPQGNRTFEWPTIHAMRHDWLNGKSKNAIANYYNVSRGHLIRILSNTSWPDPDYHPEKRKVVHATE